MVLYKKSIVSLGMFIVLVSVAIFSVFQANNTSAGGNAEKLTKNTSHVPVYPVASAGSSRSVPDDTYILKSFDGYLAIFRPENTETPESMTDIDTRTLRAYDQSILDEGITVRSIPELTALLEDYGS